jgi:hypothetical protein
MENFEEFRKELTRLINSHSLESVNDGNVPDRILADVMVNTMLSFNMNHKSVCDWYGMILEPGKTRPKMAKNQAIVLTENQYKKAMKIKGWMDLLVMFEESPINEDGDLKAVDYIHMALFELTGNERGFLEEK